MEKCSNCGSEVEGIISFDTFEQRTPSGTVTLKGPFCKECLDCLLNNGRIPNKSIQAKSDRAGSQSESKCFIATAACGTDSEPAVLSLRRLRDRILSQRLAGRTFVRLYEHASPPIARLIARSSFLRLLVKIGIVAPLAKVADRLTGTTHDGN